MLLTLEQENRLKYIDNDTSGRSHFLYNDGGKANKKDLKYAIRLHEKLTYAFGKPFIGNIEDLKRRLKEIEEQ